MIHASLDARSIIESVDSMARIFHVCNILQKFKYLKTGNFVNFLKCQNQNLQQIIYLTRLRSSINSIVYARSRY